MACGRRMPALEMQTSKHHTIMISSGPAMEFDNERALLLIELYRRHRSLWDPKDPLYYSKARKAQAWAEVASRVGGPVQEVRRKMESLLGSFRRERSRAARAHGRGLRRNYTSSWFAYDKMKFLIDRDNPKKPKRLRSENVREPGECAGGVSEAEAEADAEAEAAPFLHGLHSAFADGLLNPLAMGDGGGGGAGAEPLDVKPPRVARNGADRPPPPQHRDSWRSRRPSVMSNLEANHLTEEELADISACRAAGPEVDESALFGQYVAEKLRGYSHRTRAIVEHLMSNIIFEADMGKHDAAPLQGHPGTSGRQRVGCSPPLVVTYRSPSAGPRHEDENEDEGAHEDEDEGAHEDVAYDLEAVDPASAAAVAAFVKQEPDAHDSFQEEYAEDNEDNELEGDGELLEVQRVDENGVL